MPVRNEAKLAGRVRRYLKTVPKCYGFKIHGAASQVTGISDFIGVWNGRFFAVELKDPNNPNGMSERQKLFQHRVKKAGGIAFMARSVEEVKKVIH